MTFEARQYQADAVHNLRAGLAGEIGEAFPRFMAKAGLCIPGDSCWEWTASLTHDGYGRFTFQSGQVLAHRFSYWLFIGEIPLGIKVCHSCDNPKCCNPKHLFLGTNADNLRDMAEKGRSTHGEKNPNRKLDAGQIAAILADCRKHQEIADQYGVTRSNISSIKRGETWSRLQGVME